MREAIIEIRGLKKRFGELVVLDGVDLAVRTGETMVIMGLSGTGKSVLVKHVLGLLKPDEGEVTVDGLNLARAGRLQRTSVLRKIGMSFQNAALFDSMSARENVAFPLREHLELGEDEIQRRVDDALRLVGLPELKGAYPSELSGGMRKRVGLARALILDPEIVMFDEPTTGLDPILGDMIIETIRRTREAVGYTCVVVTHDLKLTFSLADQVALLHRGRIVFDGSAEEFRKSKDPAVVQFIAGRSSGGPIEVK